MPELRGPPGPQGPTGADGTTGAPGKTVNVPINNNDVPGILRGSVF